MKEKLINSIKKLIVTEITIYQAYMCFNMYITHSMHFRYGVIELTSKQEDKLKKIYKALLIKKLRLSEKFLKKIICA